MPIFDAWKWPYCQFLPKDWGLIFWQSLSHPRLKWSIKNRNSWDWDCFCTIEFHFMPKSAISSTYETKSGIFAYCVLVKIILVLYSLSTFEPLCLEATVANFDKIYSGSSYDIHIKLSLYLANFEHCRFQWYTMYCLEQKTMPTMFSNFHDFFF